MLQFHSVITENILLILQKNIMKKMIFSAVALVAFSVSGMANEIEEKKVEEETLSVDCNRYARASIVAETYYYGSPLSQSEFNEAYSFYYNTCTEANRTGATLLMPAFY